MRRDPRFFGPDREGLCPCGSRRRIRSCHGRRDGSWRAERWTPPTLGSATGLSLAGCYARDLNDCSSKLSREHYVSRVLLLEIGPAPLLSGPSFLAGQEKRLPASALTAKVLCDRHNNLLSPLDLEAARVFRALPRFEEDLKDSVAAPVDDFELASGPLFEAWIVKPFFGLLAKGIMNSPGGPITEWREGGEAALLDVLFRGGRWPTDRGLWVSPPDFPSAAAADLALEPLTAEGRLWAGNIEFGPFMLQLALGKPGNPKAVPRPGAVVALKDQIDVEKTLALGWPDGMAGLPVMTTRVGQMDGWDRSRERSPKS